MTNAELIKALRKSPFRDEDARVYSVVILGVAHEVRLRHRMLAEERPAMIDATSAAK